MTEHDLKTWPGPFAAVLAGTKRHEIRKADRPFAVGDVLHLREWALTVDAYDLRTSRPGSYTGRDLRVRVTHLTAGGEWGLPADVCVMSIEPVAPPLTVGAALALPEVQRGEAVVEVCDDGEWFQILTARYGAEYRFMIGDPPRWRGRWTSWTPRSYDFALPARIVPLASADADPATRGPIGGDRG